MNCVRCRLGVRGPAEAGGGVPLCRTCRAGLLLSGEERLVRSLDAAYAAVDGERPSSWEEIVRLAEAPASPLKKRIPCEICGRSEAYDPMKVRQGWPCERCHRNGLSCCMAVVSHRDFRWAPKTMCRICRAELELIGQPVEETIRPLPGVRTSPEAKP